MSLRMLKFGLLFLIIAFAFCSGANGKRISDIKCEEYRAGTLSEGRVIPLLRNPRIIQRKMYNCSRAVELIVGGEAARPHEFPHHAILGWPRNDNPDDIEDYEFRCGGSLISELFVLTAAHCFNEKLRPEIVRLGEHNLEDDDGFHHDFSIAENGIILHPDYKIYASYNDIALIRLEYEVKITYFMRPACLWTGPKFNFTKVIATGFGHNEYMGNHTVVLHKVGLDLMNPQTCAEDFEYHRKFKAGILRSQICVGSYGGKKDTCQGDSGGPVQVLTDTEGCLHHIVGVTSIGAACGFGSAAVYTRVSSFIDWIESIVWK
ncbi:serine protease snake-like [Uranotaenia lowii]|uniref:serine protease snake-like n=1 Tax=Uranotaenia lowii TaxID=190385 RepID=UPI0024789990|nr:serine protease snake-like [Uranotaenia lowii]